VDLTAFNKRLSLLFHTQAVVVWVKAFRNSTCIQQTWHRLGPNK